MINDFINSHNIDKTVSSILSGAGHLTWAPLDNKTLTLTGVNTYTGVTTVNGGVLQVGNGGTIGSISETSNVQINALGTMKWNNNNAVNTVTIPNTISGTGELFFQGQNATSGLSKSSYTLTGNNTGFSGNLKINKGRVWGNTLQSRLGNSTIYVQDTGTIVFNGSTFNNNIFVEQNAGYHDNGGGYGDMVIGAIRLEGNNTLSGNITINATSSTVLGDSTGLNSVIGGWNTGTHTLSGVISGVGDFTMSRWTSHNYGTYQAVNIFLSGTNSNTYTGKTQINGQGAVANLHAMKTGGAKAFGGSTNIEMGNNTTGQANLRMGDGATTGTARNQWDNQFADGTVMNFKNSSGNWMRFDLQGTNQTLAGINAGTLTTAGGAVIQNQNNNNFSPLNNSILTLNGARSYTYNGYLRDQEDSGTTNKLNLIWAGAGTQVLVGANINYSGTTNVNSGILNFHNTANYKSATTIENGAKLLFSNNANMAINATPDMIMKNGAILEHRSSTDGNRYFTLKMPVVVDVDASIDINDVSVANTTATNKGFFLDGGIKGGSTNSIITMNVTNAGNAVTARYANSNYIGTIIVNGIASNVSNAGSGMAIGGTLTGFQNTNFTVNGTLEFGDIGLGWATTLTNPYTFTIGALNGTGVVVSSGSGGAANFQTIKVGNTNLSATFSGVIAKASGGADIILRKVGTGVQTLSGNNTYTKGTFVDAGTLKAGHINAFGTGTITVNAGATLDKN